MKRTGEKLKAAREKLGLSLTEISMATKINPKVLAAIENGELEHLPAKTFLRGFVRSYAAYLKLDVEQIIKEFLVEMSENEPQPQKPVENQEAEGENTSLPDIEARSRTIKMIAIGSMIVLVVLILVVRNLVEKYEEEKRLEPVAEVSSEPAAPMSEVPANSIPVIQASGIPQKDRIEPSAAASPSTAQVITPLPKAGPSLAPVVKVSPVAKPSPSPLPFAKPSPIPITAPPAVAPATKPSTAPSPTPSKAPKRKESENEVIIEALDRVSLKFRINGGEPSEVILQPDQVHTIKAKGVITLEASDGGAIDIIVNGRDTGVPGDLGKPKTIHLP